jgi:uncharacterized protein (TIGR03435 family)
VRREIAREGAMTRWGLASRIGRMAALRETLCVLAMLGVTLAAQAPLEFEVASIKRNTSGDRGNSMRSMPDGTEVMVNSPIRSFIGAAYLSESGQYVGLPDWAQNERYDVTVKAPAGTTREQERQMWRALFSERMKLVAHEETTEQPIYNLIVARPDGRLGPKLKPSAHDCIAESAAARQRGGPPAPLTTDADFLDSCGMRMGAGRIISGGITIQNFIFSLRGLAGRVVRDKTGLAGFYQMDFTYAEPTQAANGGAADPNDAPSVFTALQEQLGLKLEPDKMPLQFVVIDHIERPTEN